MERLTELYMQVWDKPMFQMAQGILLGLMIAVGVALIIKGFMREERQEKEEEDDE